MTFSKPKPTSTPVPQTPSTAPQILPTPLKPIPKTPPKAGAKIELSKLNPPVVNPAYIDAAAASLHASYGVSVATIKATLPKLLAELLAQSGNQEPDPREAAFLMANVLDEGKYNIAAEEGLYYTAKQLLKTFPRVFKNVKQAQPYLRNPVGLANHVYAGINGNGNEASGDGWTYRGQGLIQATGRGNASTITDQFRGKTWKVDGQFPDFEANPELLKSPQAVYKIAVAGLREGWFSNDGQIAENRLLHDLAQLGPNPTPAQYAELRGKYVGKANMANVGRWAAAVQKATQGIPLIKPKPKKPDGSKP